MPRTKAANQKIIDQRKKEIIEASINIFTTRDYKSTTIDDIAKSLNISHGLFYHYFRNKNDLISTIFDYAKANLMNQFEIISKNYTGIEFFDNFFILFLKLIKKRENALLFNFLSKVMRHNIEKIRKAGSTEFEKFYNSEFNKNLSLLNFEGKLIQSLENTYKIIYIMIDGICNLVIDNQVKKIDLTSKAILKTFLKEYDVIKL